MQSCIHGLTQKIKAHVKFQSDINQPPPPQRCSSRNGMRVINIISPQVNIIYKSAAKAAPVIEKVGSESTNGLSAQLKEAIPLPFKAALHWWKNKSNEEQQKF